MTGLRAAAGSPGAQILGLGVSRPERVVTNVDLSATLDTSDEWIRTRTGIVSRRIAADEITVADLATDAATRALEAAGVSASDIDQVIVASCSTLDHFPSDASQVAGRLGITGGSYELNAACAGFCYGLGAAADAIHGGSAQHVLVVGAEKMSSLVDWTDRSTAILFADGAGAVVVGPSDTPGIGPVLTGTDGERGDAITYYGGDPVLRMAGQAVFRWAAAELPAMIREVCARSGIDVADLGALVLHQANERIIDAAVTALGLPESVAIAKDVRTSGNTSSASIPLGLDSLAQTGQLTSGVLVALLGFGSGMTWAGQVIRWP